MRTCVWCDKPLPEPSHKGHRQREFCDARCKQKHYLWHKQMRHDADVLAEPYWKFAYQELLARYQWLETKLQECLSDLDAERKRTDALEEQIQYYIQRSENLQADYLAQLRALGMSPQDIDEFHAYWQKHTDPTSF